MKKLLEGLLYSNVFIALCAAAITAVNQIWYGYTPSDIYYTGFVFFGTSILYGLHRLIGVRRMSNPIGRFAIVERLQPSIVLVTGLSGLGAIICVTQMHYSVWIQLIPAIVLCLLYVLPLFPGKKRLRDFPFIKLFVLSAIWAYLTAYMPMIQKVHPDYLDYGLVFERFVFILAITIPFDIRDIGIDREQGVATLSTFLGVKGSKIISQIALFAGVMSLVSVSLEQSVFIDSAIACVPGYLAAYLLIAFSNENRSDTYFLLGLDGTMILLFLGTWLLV